MKSIFTTISLLVLAFVFNACGEYNGSPNTKNLKQPYQFFPEPVQLDQWLGQYALEIPRKPLPYYGLNMYDVENEDYEAFLSNLRVQLQGVDLAGGTPYLLSVQRYRKFSRISWFVNWEQFPLPLPEDFEVEFNAAVAEFPDLAKTYNWWVSEELPDNTTPVVPDFAVEPAVDRPLFDLPTLEVADLYDWDIRFGQEFLFNYDKGKAFYGINLIDVTEENLEAMVANIQLQNQGVAFLGGNTHLYTVADYKEYKRITWIVEWPVGSGPVIESPEAFAEERRDSPVAAQFATLAKGYTWWTTPVMTNEEFMDLLDY